MSSENCSCALIADRHAATVEGLRDMLKTEFDSVYIVGDADSLHDGARRLQPALIVVDLSSAPGKSTELLGPLHSDAPASKLVVLTPYEQPAAAKSMFDMGADAVVLKRRASLDLMEAIDAVRGNRTFLSCDIALTVPVKG